MKVYIDYIFVQNLIVDFILLKETSYITKNNIKNKNAILASLIASTYVAILIWFKMPELNFAISKMLLTFIVIYICFRPSKVERYIKFVMFFLIVSILNTGTFTLVSSFIGTKEKSVILEIVFYIFSLAISKWTVSKMWKAYKRDIKNEDLIYNVKFNIGKNQYTYRAFLDTGNNVYSHSKRLPILFAETPKELSFDSKLKNIESFEIQTTTLSEKSTKTAYVIDDIVITKRDFILKTKAGVVFEKAKFSNTGDYNMILNFHLYTEEMGGIKIWI